MQNPVLCVFGASSSSKITDVVVNAVSIEVPTFHPFGAWSDKRCQHQNVHVYSFLSQCKWAQIDELITSSACHVLESFGIYPRSICQQVVARTNGKHGSTFIDCVTRIPRDYTKSSGNGIIGFRHARFLQTEWC